MSISIHALLAESDACLPACVVGAPISIHALLAESDLNAHLYYHSRGLFLSTLSLRRATYCSVAWLDYSEISIHALLAESDNGVLLASVSSSDFYPRSPCGERQ